LLLLVGMDLSHGYDAPYLLTNETGIEKQEGRHHKIRKLAFYSMT
jgi:hypothetical protein